TLVRALTGVDTDRLVEEKARGISIELGYAYLPLPNGEVLGFVDVPGHERFVHTMLSGATGIDLAVLVVAADDGVMPQTREHLNILRLLGVELGAIALTKIDTADAQRVADVETEVHHLLASLFLDERPVFQLSGRSGAGVEALREFLVERAKQGQQKKEPEVEQFRLAIDRSFSLPGIGTVVTGCVHSGQVHVGDQLAVVPGDHQARVRMIHAQNRPAQVGQTGQRCALNLVGVGHESVHRGDWIVAPSIWLATQRVDTVLSLLANEAKPLASGSIVHVHLGAGHVIGRAVILDSAIDAAGRCGQLLPGREGLVQLTLQSPVGAWHGDRFILRDTSAKRTLGGGSVLDPFAPARYRRTPERLAALAALRCATPAARLGALLDHTSLGVDLDRFARAQKLRSLDPLVASLPLRRITGSRHDVAVHTERWKDLQQIALNALAKFHSAYPDELGPDFARLRRMAFTRWDVAIFQALINELLDAGRIRQKGPWLHLPEHQSEPSAAERALCEKLLSRLLKGRFDPPWVRDMVGEATQTEAVVRTTLLRASRRGEVFQIVRDLFYHPIAVQELAAIAFELQQSTGEISAAAFRDRTGLGRKRAIQILEFFDRVGFMRRLHDRHLIRPDGLFTFALVNREPAGVGSAVTVEEHRAA
ncbi:MAG TPA: selenocysteine-specific translation elongation factor, partial [Burkholderiaceae bacterium]|nr:selenocysteine-specific translation elongation factor [Burkholderiaceae bacterium]